MEQVPHPSPCRMPHRYELATLRSPFYADKLNFYVLGKRIMARQFEPLGEVSPYLVQAVDQTLQVSPADRLAATEVLALAVAAREASGAP